MNQQKLFGVKYPHVYQPRAAHAIYESSIFENRLFDANKNSINWEKLRGLSVCLLFGMGSSRRFANSLPFIISFYQAVNESSDRQKLEIIYVPLDKSEQEYKQVRSRMPWLSLEINPSLIESFQRHYYVFSNLDRIYSTGGPEFHPPTMVIIDAHGATYKVLEIDNGQEPIETHLSRWDYNNFPFA